MTDTTTDLPAWPMKRSCPFGAPDGYQELRSTRPVARVVLGDGGTAWLLTRHADVRKVLADPRASSDRRHPGYPAFVPNARELARMGTGSLLIMDPPEHTSHRTMLTAEFTVRRIRALGPRIQALVDARIDEILASPTRPVDLVQTLALPVPSLVICELLGVPYQDREEFQRHTAAVLASGTTLQQRAEAFGALRGYLRGHVEAKDKEPGDDLLSRLVVRYRETGMYDVEVLTGISSLLLTAGHETTANMITLGVTALLEHPGQLAAVLADEDRMPAAVEELLRFFSIVDQVTCRVATDDIELDDGQVIRAGEGIVAANAAANRDPSVFADPDQLDLSRSTLGHVAFGYGFHQCLGQNLARLELEIVYRTLFRRIPGLRLAAPLAEMPFKDAVIYGLERLDVTW